jgi:hypothetical protein
MAELVTAIHVSDPALSVAGVRDARHKAGHDEFGSGMTSNGDQIRYEVLSP